MVSRAPTIRARLEGEEMNDVTTSLLDGDPTIRWQVLRDLSDASAAEVGAERVRVAETGWGKGLLDLQADGQWADGACFPSRDWRPPGLVVGDPDDQPWIGIGPAAWTTVEATGISRTPLPDQAPVDPTENF